MATLKIGNAHNESGQKFFASNDLTTNSTDLLWKGARVLTEASFTVSGDFEGTGSADSPLSWKGFKAENAEGTVLSETVKTIKAGTNVTLSAQDGVLTIESEGGTGGSVDLSDYTTTDNISLKTTASGKTVTMASNGGRISIYNTSESYASFSIDGGTVKLNGSSIWLTASSSGGVNVGSAVAPVTFVVGSLANLRLQVGISGAAASANTANGLVVLGSDGKIPSNLYEAGGSGTEIDWSNVNATEIKLNGSEGIWFNTIMNDIFLKPQNGAGTLFIDAIDIQFNEVGLNQPTGLVQLGADGKIPVELYDAGSGGGTVDLSNYTTSKIKLTSSDGAVQLITGNGYGSIQLIVTDTNNPERATFKTPGVWDIQMGSYLTKITGTQQMDIEAEGSACPVKITAGANGGDIELEASGTLKYNGADLNTANGLVQLGSNGKLPTSLYEAGGNTDLSSYTGFVDITGKNGDSTIHAADGNLVLSSDSKITLKSSNVSIEPTTGGGTFSVDVTSSGSVKFTAGSIYFNNNASNTAGGFAIVGGDGKLPGSILPSMNQTWARTTLNQSDFSTTDETYGGSYKELDGICTVEIYDADGYKVEFDVKCDFIGNKTRVYIPSGLAADTISNWTLLYLAKTIA